MTSVGAVARLELVEAAAVDQARDHLAHVVWLARVARHDAVDLGGIVGGGSGVARVDGRRRRRRQRGEDVARDARARGVVVGEVIGDAGDAGVDVAAAELLGGHLLAGRGLHQRRAAEEDRALVLDDDGLVAHRRARRRRPPCTSPSRPRPAGCRPPTCAPGCRRCGRSARGRGRPRPAAAGTRRPNRPGRRTAGGSRARSPARAGASSPSSG